MAVRCKFDNEDKDIFSLSLQGCLDWLRNCEGCVHYYYCQKACELNDRLKQLENKNYEVN